MQLEIGHSSAFDTLASKIASFRFITGLLYIYYSSRSRQLSDILFDCQRRDLDAVPTPTLSVVDDNDADDVFEKNTEEAVAAIFTRRFS